MNHVHDEDNFQGYPVYQNDGFCHILCEDCYPELADAEFLCRVQTFVLVNQLIGHAVVDYVVGECEKCR